MRDILGHLGEDPEPELEMEQEPEQEIFHLHEEQKKFPKKKRSSPVKKFAEDMEPRSAKPTPAKKSAAKSSTSKRSTKKGAQLHAEPTPIEEEPLEAIHEELVQQVEAAESAEPEQVIGLPSVAYQVEEIF